MTLFYLTLALITQIIVAQPDDINAVKNNDTILETPKCDDVVKDYQKAPLDWMDVVIGPSTPVYPSPSATLMAQAVQSDKPPEEQLEEIKEMANQITMAIQTEMVNLLSYAVSATDGPEGNKLRKKRSAETPMDSTQLVMRLLKHIKSNNDYQNIAIEKMMSAQEIADKYNIPFKADPEILSDLALAGTDQAKELTSILQDICDVNNTTRSNQTMARETTPNKMSSIPAKPKQDDYFSRYNYYSEPAHYCSVTPKPTFYDAVSYTPVQELYPYCGVEPMSSVLLEPIEAEPEFVGEEIEETVSSKISMKEDDEPGTMSVNHVTTYSVAETSHFKKPHIETIPQQMQYYFLLM
ncbi:unnamed protein product [Pieris macdunnoughi]|uniref:Uncharacterized protein n=1 Tax=Pieris macdunnoughi TaxID=345717 RepID=A0A821U741_9NEOP|nr:unnamed protein product [Pieris macdunnoughi]